MASVRGPSNWKQARTGGHVQQAAGPGAGLADMRVCFTLAVIFGALALACDPEEPEDPGPPEMPMMTFPTVAPAPTPRPTLTPHPDPCYPDPPDCHDPNTPVPRPPALVRWDDDADGEITCAEAVAHGIAPVRRGHPAYDYMRDQDNDGEACDW